MIKINDKIKTKKNLCFKEDEEVIIKDIILKPNNEHSRGVFPLIEVEHAEGHNKGKIEVLTHRFFKVKFDKKYVKVV